VACPVGQGPLLYGDILNAQVEIHAFLDLNPRGWIRLLRKLTPAGRIRCAHASVGWLRHPRIELLLNAVRGQRPEPLDEGSVVACPVGQGPLLYGGMLNAQVKIHAFLDLNPRGWIRLLRKLTPAGRIPCAQAVFQPDPAVRGLLSYWRNFIFQAVSIEKKRD